MSNPSMNNQETNLNLTNTQASKPVFIDPKPVKKSKTPLIFLLILLVIIFLVVIYFLFLKEDKKTPTSNSNTNTNENTKEQSTLDFSWVGQYVGGGYTLDLYYSSLDSIAFSLTSMENGQVRHSSIDMDLPVGNKITYEDDFTSKTTVTIEKTSTGIKLVSSCDDTTDMLANLNLEMTKQMGANNAWNGVYQKNDEVIILSEVSPSYCYITLISSTNGFFVGEVTIQENTLNYQSMDGGIATITKKEAGLQIESDIVSSGEYVKK